MGPLCDQQRPPGTHDEALADIRSFGWGLVGEDNTPFGPEFVVQIPSSDAAITAAQWSLSQEIESYHQRQPLNDLSRVRVGISADPLTLTNYLGLTGTNIVIGLNDTGVDATHPDLVGRISGLAEDFNGHGTHVAGTTRRQRHGIFHNQRQNWRRLTLPAGSSPGSRFSRGVASQASSIYVQLIDLVLGPFHLETRYFETNAADATRGDFRPHKAVTRSPMDSFGTNNSWGYGATFYDINAASFDQAVRDSLLLVSAANKR